MAQYVTRMTPEQMAAESKKATEEGMRQVAAGLAARGLKSAIYLEDSDSDETVVKKKKNVVIDNGVLVNKLETRIHYMQLDMANKSVDLQDANTLIQEYRDKHEVLKRIDDNILLLTNLSFYLNNINTLTLEQVQKKLTLFKEESHEHAGTCLFYIKKIEFQLIKNYMILALDEMNAKNSIIEKKIIQVIRYKIFLRYLQLWFIIFSIISAVVIPILHMF